MSTSQGMPRKPANTRSWERHGRLLPRRDQGPVTLSFPTAGLQSWEGLSCCGFQPLGLG